MWWSSMDWYFISGDNNELMFVNRHSAVKKFFTIIFIVWQQLLTIFNSWSFNLYHQHVKKHTSYTKLPILKKIHDVIHMFLWNAKVDNTFPYSDPWTAFNEFIEVSNVKVFIWCRKSSISQSTIFKLFGPAMHNTHINIVVTLHNLDSVVNFS